MRIITRAEWGARAPVQPKDQHYTTWDKRPDVAVHYTYGSKTQSLRSIQDFCIRKGHNDIDYNALVDYKGNIYEGRIGIWLAIGSHNENNNTRSLGVCFIGFDADVTDAAKAAIRWVYDEACRRAGKTLNKRWHSYYKPTSCPGPTLRAWVDAGMPNPLVSQEVTMYCQHGDESDQVESMQLALRRVDPAALPEFGVDREYGDETAGELARIAGFGDGRRYGPKEHDALMALAYRGPKGERGLAGATPREVKLILPSIAVVGSVVATD